MATGYYSFRDVRVAVEGTPGTKEDTADQRLLGVVTCPLGGPILHRPVEERGSLANQRRSVVVGEHLPLTFEGDLLYDSASYLLGMGIQAKAAKDSGSDPYLWNYIPSLISLNNPASCTFQFGDNLAVYDVARVFATELGFRGGMDETVKMRASLLGQNFEVGAFAPAVGDTTIDPATTEVGLGNKCTLYIDAAAVAPGTGVKVATLISFDWRLDTGFVPMKYGGSTIYWDGITQKFPKVICSVTALFNTTMATEQLYHKAGTVRNFAIKIGGTGVDTLQLNFSGVYTSFETLDELEGIDVVSFTVESEYAAGITSLFSAILTNSLAAQV